MYFLIVLEAGKSIRVPANLISGGVFLSGLRKATFLLCPNILIWQVGRGSGGEGERESTSTHKCLGIPSYKVTNLVGSGLHPYDLI